MNTTTAAQCFQTISALSLALLIGGTASAHHRSDLPSEDGLLHEAGHTVQSKTGCAKRRGATLFNLGMHQNAPQCVGSSSSNVATPAPIRLAKPLAGNPYRSNETIRYSF
ncbi:MAG: hypothetical protein CMK99_06330 [Pseudomonas sp.]|nr:hypothetical protein [Pseudomonas sp.]|tara:strand:+ start:5764 stop:6093 length:330 start_codon:yes stop_codon:yes gene_type:complete